jgi:hypothetical protein
MNKILVAVRDYFVSVYRSAWDMEFYRGVRQKPWARALGYFALLNLIFTVAAQFVFAGAVSDAVKKGKDYIRAKIPEGAYIELKRGHFATDLETPMNFSDKDFTFIIDPSVVGMDFPEALEGKDGVLLGRDALFANDIQGKIEIQSFEKAPDFKLTKDMVMGWADKWSSLAVLLASAAFAMAYYIGSSVGIAFFVLFGSFLAYFIGRMFRAAISYGQWVAVSFHAVTVPMAAEAVFSLLKLEIPWLFSALYFLYAAAVIADERNRIAPQPAEPKPEPDAK